MDILKSTRLVWTVNSPSLDMRGITLDGHPLTATDLRQLNQPIQLRTPNLVLNLIPVRYAHWDEKVEFSTGPTVTPLQILGAIYTYYNTQLTNEELNELGEQGDEMVKEEVELARSEIEKGTRWPRAEMMGDQVYFEGLEEEPDNSYVVKLGS